MVTYGAWTQDDNYTTTATLNDEQRANRCIAVSVDRFHSLYGLDGYETEGGPDWVVDSLFMSIEGNLTDVPDTISDPAGTVGANFLRRSSILVGGSVDVFRNEAVFEKDYWPQPISYYDTFWAPSDMPDNAVGIEFQGHPEWGFAGKAERVGVMLKAESLIEATTSETAKPAEGQTYNFRIGFADLPRAQRGTYLSADVLEPAVGFSHIVYQDDKPAGGSGPELLGVDIDLTPYIRNLAIGGVLFTTNDGFVPAVDLEFAGGLTAYYQDWTYGTFLSFPVIAETYKPPVYRWIFDTVPIQQTTHRDDELAGGAYQTWPTSKSEQNSNRTFGGYR